MSLESFRIEYRRYADILDRALEQTDETSLNAQPTAAGNSIAMVLAHLAGNLRSRFTEFLTSDGEKPWRDREEEFAIRRYAKDELLRSWREAWSILDATLAGLTEADLSREVRIRGIALSVADALARSSAHLAYHVGQIVLLAHMHRGSAWRWISIPRGGSAAYNAAPDKEKGLPGRGTHSP
ncbi:MAG: DUF1572 family protein [Planctomycetes bacterium]|nr:DUF1572 family protein [Planctomycetota bacterium]